MPRFNQTKSAQIRDPIHGSIPISSDELKLVDDPFFHRLRNIKQTGFAELAFPGATHTRYSHSLGAMHLATQIFDRLFKIGDLDEATRLRFRQTVRLAMLFHDIGHAPLSHSTEIIMPRVELLNLPKRYLGAGPARQATHEDYTIKIITGSALTNKINSLFNSYGISADHIADLIYPVDHSPHFVSNGLEYTPILQQIISSEVDADRMDYLQRDSIYSGVNYGKFDCEWLIDNMVPVEEGGRVFQGLLSRSMFCFEDFLLSRYHMFASVYFHHVPVIMDKLLEKYLLSQHEFTLPSDIDEYIKLDDMDLWHDLRKSDDPLAKQLVNRRAYYLLDELTVDSTKHEDFHIDHNLLQAALTEQGIDSMSTCSTSIISKYYQKNALPVYVCTNAGHLVSLEDYSPLYGRYHNPSETRRIFVEPQHAAPAMEVLSKFFTSGPRNGKN